MLVDELYALQPAQHNPEDIIVGLLSQSEGILTEIVSDQLGEVFVDQILVEFRGRERGEGRRDGAEGSRYIGPYYRRRPIDTIGPKSLPMCKVFDL